MPRWLAGLRPGGRLLVPLTVDPSMSAGGYTLLVTRTGERWSARFTGQVAIYPCDPGEGMSAQDAEIVRRIRERCPRQPLRRRLRRRSRAGV